MVAALSVTFEDGHTHFLRHSDIGLGVIGVGGLISAVSTFCLLVYLVVPPVRRAVSTSAVSSGVSKFVRDPLGWYMVNMLLSDFLQGGGFVINLLWARHSAIWLGPACTAQAAVTEVGDVGCAIFSLLITLHTFLVLFLRRTPPAWSSAFAVGLSWVLILFLALVGPLHLEHSTGKGSFYGNSGGWCWISSSYQVERFFFLYFFILLASGTSWVCYSLLFVRTRRRAVLDARRSRRPARTSSASRHDGVGVGVGVLSITSTVGGSARRDSGTIAGKAEGPPLFADARRSSDVSVEEEQQGGPQPSADDGNAGQEDDAISALSTRMLWYPIAYSCIIIPVSISRLSVMNNTPVPLAFVLFSGILFSSSGTVNVILWLATRQSYIAREARRISYSVMTTVEISPPSGYVLSAFHDGAMSNQDALSAAENDLARRALDESPFVGGELVVGLQSGQGGGSGSGRPRRRSGRFASTRKSPPCEDRRGSEGETGGIDAALAQAPHR